MAFLGDQIGEELKVVETAIQQEQGSGFDPLQNVRDEVGIERTGLRNVSRIVRHREREFRVLMPGADRSNVLIKVDPFVKTTSRRK